jgi:hypothetical protein
MIRRFLLLFSKNQSFLTRSQNAKASFAFPLRIV